MKKYYPIFLDLAEKTCLVVGAGTLATSKAEQLLEAGAQVHLVGPELHARLQSRQESGRLIWHQRPFQDSDLDQAFLTFVISADVVLNQHIFQTAEAQGKLVNVVDVMDEANFIMPAVASAGPVQVAVSTSGTSPVLAKGLRDQIREHFIDSEVGLLAEYLGNWRTQVKARLPTYESRRLFWERVFTSEAPVLVKNGKPAQADKILTELLAFSESSEPGSELPLQTAVC